LATFGAYGSDWIEADLSISNRFGSVQSQFTGKNF
jgi:hypothetical protein